MTIIPNNHGYECISDHDELKQYFDLQGNLALRHAKALSLNHYEGVRIALPHKSEPYTLLVPYDTKKTISSIRYVKNKGQSLYAMTSYGVLKETGLRVEEMEMLGTPIEPELVEQGEPSRIFIVVVSNYYKRLVYEPLYENTLKVGPPVWIHLDLLSSIFEKVSSEEDRYQLETYRRSKKWFSTKTT